MLTTSSQSVVCFTSPTRAAEKKVFEKTSNEAEQIVSVIQKELYVYVYVSVCVLYIYKRVIKPSLSDI